MKNLYMIVDENNMSIIRGVSKAGFIEIGRGCKNRFGQYVIVTNKE